MLTKFSPLVAQEIASVKFEIKVHQIFFELTEILSVCILLLLLLWP